MKVTSTKIEKNKYKENDILTRLENLEIFMQKIKIKKFLKKKDFYLQKKGLQEKSEKLKNKIKEKYLLKKNFNLDIEKIKKTYITKEFDNLEKEKIKKNYISKEFFNQEIKKIKNENSLLVKNLDNKMKKENLLLKRLFFKKIKDEHILLKENLNLEIIKFKMLKQKIRDLKIEINNKFINLEFENKLLKEKNNNLSIIKELLQNEKIKKNNFVKNDNRYIRFIILKDMIDHDKNIEEIKLYLDKNFDILKMMDKNNHSILYYSVINCNKKLIHTLNQIHNVKFDKNEFADEKIKKHYDKIINYFLDSENYKKLILKYAFDNELEGILETLLLKYPDLNLDEISKEVYDVFEKTKNINIMKIIIKALIKRGKSINDKDSNGEKLIHHFFAQKINNLDFLKFIIKLGGNINDKDNLGGKVIHYAIRNSFNLEIIKYLFSIGANIKDKIQNILTSMSCIHIAAYNKNTDVLKYLISIDNNIDEKDKNGRKVIHHACKENILENIKYLLLLGANINEMDNYGKSGLDLLNSKNRNILKTLKLI